MGWSVLLAFVILTGAALLRWGRLESGTVALAGAALLVAAAGYAWQGSPTLAGAPATPREGTAHDGSLFALVRPVMLRASPADAVLLDRAEQLHLRGLDDVAARELGAAVRTHPDDAALWTGLGNALLLHADGAITPAARLAFARALAIEPDAPTPLLLTGVALAQGGQLADAAAVWRGMLARAPADARWRPLVEMLLARAAASGQGMAGNAGEDAR